MSFMQFSYHWRQLLARKTSSAMTVLVITAVVGVLSWLIGFSTALEDSLDMAASNRKLIVIKRGATSEANSSLMADEYNRLSQLGGVATDAESGERLIAPQMLVQVLLPRKRDNGLTSANVAVRGVTHVAFKIHTNVNPHGAVFSKGEREVIVGEACAAQFTGLDVGDTIHLGYGGDRAYKIVGHFSAGGGPMESEIWGYLPSLMNSYNRAMYSSANVLLAPDTDASKAIADIDGPAIALAAQTERDYWQAQSKNVRRYLTLAHVLAGVMCLAAVFAVANTMYASVAGRVHEIAMLRTIGYTGRRILLGIIVESVLLSLVGGLLGCAACMAWLKLVGHTKDMFTATTFTTLAFDIRLTAGNVVLSLVAVCVVGVGGALWPAIRAARLGIIDGLREV